MIQCELFTQPLWDKFSEGCGVIVQVVGWLFQKDIEFTLIYLIPKLTTGLTNLTYLN
jgi:hypothetical protein